MKERIIRFNWGTKRKKKKIRTERKKWPKTGAFARHIHVYLSIGSTPPPGDLPNVPYIGHANVVNPLVRFPPPGGEGCLWGAGDGRVLDD